MKTQKYILPLLIGLFAATAQEKKADAPKECTTANPMFRAVTKRFDGIKYSWKVDVSNPFNHAREVMVKFSLKDKDGFELTYNSEIETIPAGETITVTSTYSLEENVFKQATSCEAKVTSSPSE